MGNVIWHSLALLAADNGATAFGPDYWQRLGQGAVGTVVYGLLGIGLVVLGFKVFDWINPHIDIQRELAEKNNLAVAVVVAAIILGICYLITVTVA